MFKLLWNEKLFIVIQFQRPHFCEIDTFMLDILLVFSHSNSIVVMGAHLLHLWIAGRMEVVCDAGWSEAVMEILHHFQQHQLLCNISILSEYS